MIEIIYTLVATHLTIICVTLYLHRSQTHRSVTFHPVITHLMRFWLWLTTGMITKQWVAVHRLHHAYTDSAQDPHSPQQHGLLKVLFGGVFFYARAAQDKITVDNLSKDCSDDWIERNLYDRYHWLGIVLLLILTVFAFGIWGLAIWLIQIVWIPFWAAGVVNGVGHYFGYRNAPTRDASRNFFPWGIIIGGEELHSNHHLAPASARLSLRWFEFDLGWVYICILKQLGLAQVRQP